MQEDKCIPASVGILTYNSAATLERCLESLNGFCEIIIADGGSADETLNIARRCGCKIIQQSKQGVPLDDFSRERNHLLDAASYDWFFYLDSDEVMSAELKEEITRISRQKEITHYIYNVPYRITSEDLKIKYRSFRAYHQPRFFNRKSDARFIKKAHERILFDGEKYKQGVLKGCWYVPLDVQLDFAVYKEKVQYRIQALAEEWRPRNFSDFARKGIIAPLKNLTKQAARTFYLRMRYGSSELVPMRYEFFRMYSQLVHMKKFSQRYFKRNA